MKDNKPNDKPLKDTQKNDSDNGADNNRFLRIKAYLQSRYEFRNNIVSNTLEYRRRPQGHHAQQPAFTEVNENDLLCELMEANFNGVEKSLIALLKSSFIPRYNPFEYYFKNLPEWKTTDTDYIEQLASYLKVKDRERFNQQFKKALVRSIACALNMIPFNKHCLTLIGKQNDGKTSFIRFLCPPALADYMKEEITTDKFGRFSLAQNFMINLDELSGLTKYELEQVKKLFTLEKIKDRVPFDRKDSIFFRRASFWGSTNKTEILTDETGSVRWLCFEVEEINFDYSKQVNIDLVYAQAYALLRSGFEFKLTPKEIEENDITNKKYQVVTDEMNLIVKYYRPGTKEKNHVFYTTTDLVKELTDKTEGKVRLNNIKIGKALATLGYKKEQKYIPDVGYQLQGYYLLIVDQPQQYMADDLAPRPGITEQIPKEHLPEYSQKDIF